MIFGTYMHEDKAECRAPKKGPCSRSKYLLLLFIFGTYIH